MGREFNVIGKQFPRVEAREKATGEFQFVGDLLNLPNMLYAKILRSPHAHALVAHIDTSKAERFPGVKAVLTHQDVNGQFVTRAISANPQKPRAWDSYALEEEVRYVGDRVAAVAALAPEIAEEALRLIEVDYEPLPAVFDPAEALRPGAPKVHKYNFTPEEAFLIENNVVAPMVMSLGDIEKGFKDADLFFENEFRTSYQFNSPLACPVCVCRPLPNGAIEVWNHSQGIHWTRMCLSASLGLPLSKVKIHRIPFGGAFGLYIYQRFSDVICCLLAMRTRLPVRIEETREEMVLDGGRHPSIIRLRTGVNRNGNFTATEMKLIDGVGAYSSGTSTLKLQCGFFMSMYRCPNKRFEGYAVYTNTPPLGACRGAGNPEVTFAVEQQADIIAERMNMDPLEFRLRNLIGVGDTYYGQGPDIYCTIKTCGTEVLIKKGAMLIGWEKRKDHTPYLDRPWIKRGLGVASGHHTSGTSSAEARQKSSFMIDYSGAMIKMNEDGTASVITASADAGMGALSVVAAIAAEAIGLRYEDVMISETDSDISLWDQGTMASRHTFTMGHAVREAGLQVKKQVIGWASKMLSVPVEELDAKESYVFLKENPSNGISFDEVLQHAQSQSWGTATGTASLTSPSCPPHFVVTFIEVEVDTRTGEVKVVKAIQGADVGTAICPASVRGQLLGGLHMGLGYALTETLIHDRQDGRVLNPNFIDYKLFTPLDMPNVETFLADTYEPTGPFGAKGIGEGAMNPAPAAVFNAVANALGVRIFNSPLTPEKVLEAVQSRTSKERP
jgi:CO/xanthine dehydrogenase Mo-binding subunit